jgi:hypothetical protein
MKTYIGHVVGDQTSNPLASSNEVISACDSFGAGELSEQQLRELLEGVGGLSALLANSNSAERQQVYRAAGVNLRYQRSEEVERITASLRRGVDSCRRGDLNPHALAGTSPSSWRVCLFRHSDWLAARMSGS